MSEQTDNGAALAVIEDTPMRRGNSTVFTGISGFEEAQRIASALSRSTIVPEIFQRFPVGKEENMAAMANCLIGLELAQRMHESPLIIMQNLYVVKGKPSFAATFLIAKVNSCGLFSRMKWEKQGTLGQPDYRVRAYADDLETGELLYGTWITPAMVKGEGWGNKWATMPEQMYDYRAASFWTRAHAPDITLGMLTREEVEDVAEKADNRGNLTELNRNLRQTIASRSGRACRCGTGVEAEVAAEVSIEQDGPTAVPEPKADPPEPIAAPTATKHTTRGTRRSVE